MSISENANNQIASPSHEVTIFAEPVFHIGGEAGGFQVTNSLLTSWLAVIIIIIFSLIIKLNIKKIPNKIQHIFEILLEGSLSLCDQVTNDRKITEKIFPLVFSIFIFILINNWIGIFPFIGSIGYILNEAGYSVFVPLFRGGTADINTTLTLGIISVIGSNIFGIITLGLWKTLNKYVKLEELGSIVKKVKKDPSVLIIAPISFFVGIIEFIGEIAKIASLSFRLFGNIFAGEVLLSSMATIFAFILPTPFLFLEVFIGLIQALIFSLLSAVYFTIAAQDHSEHHKNDNEKKSNALVHV